MNSSFLKNWRTNIINGVKEFWFSLKRALAQNFNAKFLKSVVVILVVAAIISSIIISFTLSTRTGWYSIFVWGAIFISWLVAILLKDNFIDRLGIFSKAILSIVSMLCLCYFLGRLTVYLIPPVNPINFDTEGYCLTGLVILFFLALFAIIIGQNYSDGKKKSRWKNKTEYAVHLLRLLVIIAIGIGGIYLLVHYITPLLA